MEAGRKKNEEEVIRKSEFAMRRIPRNPEEMRLSYIRKRKANDEDDSRSIADAGRIVNAIANSLPKRDPISDTSKIRFTRDMLHNVRVIGQFDKKFIICQMRYPDKSGGGLVEHPRLLVAFDQHAVHERIKLELLYRENKLSMFATLPDSIRATLASAACKSAIRFGEKLSRMECKDLIVALRECVQPFQCAHGRPSIVPLIVL